MLLVLFSFCLSSFREDHAIDISVSAPWAGVPLFDQLLSFTGEHSIEAAQQFIETLFKTPLNLENNDYLYSQISRYFTEDAINTLRAKIDLNVYLPRFEMFREMARSMGGTNYPDVLIAGEKPEFEFSCPFFQRENPSIQNFDLKFGNSKTIVYANLHRPNAQKFIKQLLQDKQSFVLRPTSFTKENTVDMKGYTFEMRPFRYSMEYSGNDQEAEIDSKSQSNDLRDNTTQGIENIPEADYINISSIDKFGARLVSYLMKHDEKPLPEMIRDITNNWPVYVPILANEEITRDIIEEYEKLAAFGDNPKTIVSINGRLIPMHALEIYDFLDILDYERNLNELIIKDLGLKDTNFTKRNIVRDTTYLLDYRSKYIHWVNDYETNPKYATWTTDVNELFHPQAGKLPQVRKNLLNLIVYIDPTTEAGMLELFSTFFLIQQGFPFRLGILPYFNMGDRISRKVAFAFHHLAKVSSEEAVTFLLDSFAIAGFDKETKMPNPVTEDIYVKSYARHNKGSLKWEQLSKTFTPNTDEFISIKETHDYFKYCGASLGLITINGKPTSLMGGIQSLMYQIQGMLVSTQNMIYKQGVTDLEDVDIVDLLSQQFFVVPSINKEILDEPVTGFNIYERPIIEQRNLLKLIKTTKWDSVDHGKLSSFYLLFPKESEDLDEFKKFMKSKHSLPAAFAINPKGYEEFTKIDPNITTLIVNGRIYRDINISDKSKLRMIDNWSKQFIGSQVDEELPFETIAFLNCFVSDFKMHGITRTNLTESFIVQNSTLSYQSTVESDMKMFVISNPASTEYQKIADFVNYLDKNKVVNLYLLLTPSSVVDAEHVSSFYRSAFDSSKISFSMLNDTTTYSAMIHAPYTWVTEIVKATIDVDNIFLQDLNPGVHEAKYYLTNIVLDGACHIIKDNARLIDGLDIALLDQQNNQVDSTIVMGMNHYYQFSAKPGQFHVDVLSSQTRNNFAINENTITIHSFKARNRDIFAKSTQDVEEDKKKSVRDMIEKKPLNSSRVDVFAVASGHLYERLVKIMMISVKRNTKSKLKFWLLKNFLSPTFKASLAGMAKKYGFDYEFVSYHWPRWLTPQKEKQRIIWGNKILFLDTLFPVDLQRVIYVDADQIVRSDLHELMTIDFGEAPYAFTPFCDSREETEDFRFWKQGSWQQVLGNTYQYHISALFAIDLQKFRQVGAGEWLRYNYQNLVNDPNSLANLDQDLPNFIQNKIPIYSLPQNWLWCETWCSDETMDEAKTIDLCNNPLTKKPKIEIAKERVKEWPELDKEARDISADVDDYIKQIKL